MQMELPFAEAIVKKYPEQVAIVIAREKNGKLNPITIGWLMLTSHMPPMMAFSVGRTRYSLEVLYEAGECVIAFPSEHQAAETFLFGTKSGRNADKLAESGIAVSPAKKIDSVLLNDAVANFECRITGSFPTGDHIIFTGEIVASHVNPDSPGRLYTVAKGFKLSGVTVKGH